MGLVLWNRTSRVWWLKPSSCGLTRTVRTHEKWQAPPDGELEEAKQSRTAREVVL